MGGAGHWEDDAQPARVLRQQWFLEGLAYSDIACKSSAEERSRNGLPVACETGYGDLPEMITL
jgi:hypothetical protein